jgi:cytochrome c biogenesis protein CcmG/thiol:disulfide interchange protein DsbE
MPTETKLKPTTNPKQAWLTLALVVIVSVMFGGLVLPMLGRPKQSILASTPAPEFNLEVIAGGDLGNRFSLANQRGKVVVLDFWASWCVPCRQQAPIVNDLAKEYPASDVVFIGVNTSDRKEDGITWFKSQNLEYASLYDEDNRVAVTYGVKALPTLIVIDKSGIIRAAESRVVPKEELEQLVRTAQAQ